MEKYDSARLGLGIKIQDYLDEKAEKKAEVKQIVEEVLGDIPDVIEELKKSDVENKAKIKELEDAIKSLQERSD